MAHQISSSDRYQPHYFATSVAIYCLGASPSYARGPDIATSKVQRNQIQKRLSQRDPKQLVIVRYNEHHNYHHEWIFNRADIDASKVIWAREMQPENNSRLLSYFNDREVWLLEPDRDPDRLAPYPRWVGANALFIPPERGSRESHDLFGRGYETPRSRRSSRTTCRPCPCRH